MNKKGFILGILVLAMLAAIIVMINNRERSYLWEVRLNDSLYEPYDLGYFMEIIEDSYEDDYQLVNRKLDFEQVVDSGTGTMLYIGNNISLSYDHVNELAEFISRGNTVFFSSNLLPQNLIKKISGVHMGVYYDTYTPKEFTFDLTAQNELEDYIELEEESFYWNQLYIEDTLARVSFDDSSTANEYKFKFIQKDTVESCFWNGIMKPQFEEYKEEGLDFRPESIMNDSLYDMYSLNHGDGKLYVHMNPMMFSNIYFKEASGFDYAQDISKLFSDGGLFYNKYHNYVSSSTRRNLTRNSDGSGGSGDSDIYAEDEKSPLTFILSHKSLKWSVYSLLILTAIYLLFATKRRLPILEHFKKPKNTSLSFVRALSSFYYSAKNHVLLSDEMIKNFESYVRKRYRIKTNLDQKELIPIISKHSGVSTNVLEEIYDHEFKINFSEVNKAKKAVELYEALEFFYQNCK